MISDPKQSEKHLEFQPMRLDPDSKLGMKNSTNKVVVTLLPYFKKT